MDLHYENEMSAMAELQRQADVRAFIENAHPDPLPSSLNAYGHSWIEVALDWIDQPISTYEMRSGVKCSAVTVNALAELEAHKQLRGVLRDLLADVLNLGSSSVTLRPSVKAAREALEALDV